MELKELIDYIILNKLQECIFKNGDIYDENDDILLEKYRALPEFETIEHICNTDEMYIIVLFKKLNVYLRLTGDYDSYGESNHYYNDKVSQVFPESKIITVYKSK